MSSNPIRELEDQYRVESQTEKLKRKAKEAPYMAVGLTGALLGVAYGALKFKNRGQMSPSIYLIHLRVAAQGAVVSAITIGVAYTLLKDYVFNTPATKEQ